MRNLIDPANCTYRKHRERETEPKVRRPIDGIDHRHAGNHKSVSGSIADKMREWLAE